MKKSAYTPLAELSSPRCDLQNYLEDYVPVEHIGLAVDRLDHAARLGGFLPGVRITGYSGELDRETPTIVGNAGQDTAVAGLLRARQKPIVDADMHETSSILYRHRTPLDLHVNVTELSDRVSRSKGDKPLRNPAIWSGHLDDALAGGLRDAAWRHLVKSRPPIFEGALTTLMLGSDAANLAAGLGSGSLQQPEAARNVAISLVTLSIARLIHQRMLRGAANGTFYSAVPLWHVDRALAVSAATRMAPLARHI